MSSTLLNHPIVMALGWTLIHSLWLALFVALIVRLIWLRIDSQKAELRYRISLLAMLGILLGSASVFSYYLGQYSASYGLDEAGLAYRLSEGSTLIDPILMSFSANADFTIHTFWNQIENYLPILVLLWILGTLLMGIRLGGSWYYLHHLGKKGLMEPGTDLKRQFGDLCTKMGIYRPVQLFLSDRINEPITLKHIKPIILFPVGLVTQLSIEQVEVILLHELAHIRRHDYLINWMQSILELLFFYHPAVWWLSTQVREAREHCCDDLVLKAGQRGKMLYARTLTQVSAYSINSKSKLAMSYNGNNQSFTQRVKRLFGQADQGLDWRKAFLSGAMALLIGILFLSNTVQLSAETDLPPASPDTEIVIKKDTIPTWQKELLKENPNREPAIFLDRKLIGYGEQAKAKIDQSKVITVKEYPAEWAMLDFGKEARWGAVTYFTQKTVKKEPQQEAIEGKKAAPANPFDFIEKLEPELRPQIIIDGETMKPGIDLSSILKPEDIATINVYKGKSAKEAFDVDEGGVVEIITKKRKKSTSINFGEEGDINKSVFKVGVDGEEKVVDPLVVLDNKVLGRQSQLEDNINMEKVAMAIFKGPDPQLFNQYGKEAKDGVLLLSSEVPKTQVVVEGFEKTEEAKNDSDIKTDLKLSISNPNAEEKPLYVVDGVKMGRELDINKDIDPENIATVNVFKGESAIAKWGEEGAQGVVVINTKQKSDTKLDATNEEFQNKLVFLNGKKLGLWKDVNTQIDKNLIKEVKMYGKGYAPDKYKAYNDQELVIIGYKNGANQFKVESVYEEAPAKDQFKEIPKDEAKAPIIISNISKSNPAQPLFVVNEKVLGISEDLINKLQPEDIESITVLKDVSAIKKYGQDGKDGVIEIYLKGYKPKKQNRKNRKKGKAEKTTTISKMPTVTGYQKPVKVDKKATDLDALPSPNATATPIQSLVEGLKIFPNPFSQNIAVSFNLPEAGRMRVSVFDNAGKLVKVLADEDMQAGYQEFVWQGTNVAAGNYTLVLDNGSGIKMSKNIVKQ